jgi:K+-transporting ATPase A subunit
MHKASVLTIVFSLFIIAGATAQESQPEMADAMRTDGKIYVVVLVLATIFAGIIAYLVRIERKINKIEKNK